MTTHALVTPWPISAGLYTWCGQSLAGASSDDRIAAKATVVDCPRCQDAMRGALRTLETWVPGLVRLPLRGER